MNAIGKIEFDFGTGMSYLFAAQQFGGQERIRTWCRWPDIVTDPGNPQGIEAQAGTFQRTEHLYRRLTARFRLENPLPAQLRQPMPSFLQYHRAEDAIKGGQTIQRFEECPTRLELMAGERSFAGPRSLLQPQAKLCRPIG